MSNKKLLFPYPVIIQIGRVVEKYKDYFKTDEGLQSKIRGFLGGLWVFKFLFQRGIKCFNQWKFLDHGKCIFQYSLSISGGWLCISSGEMTTGLIFHKTGPEK